MIYKKYIKNRNTSIMNMKDPKDALEWILDTIELDFIGGDDTPDFVTVGELTPSIEAIMNCCIYTLRNIKKETVNKGKVNGKAL